MQVACRRNALGSFFLCMLGLISNHSSYALIYILLPVKLELVTYSRPVVVVEMQVIMISIYRHTASANAHPIPNSHLCHRYRESLG